MAWSTYICLQKLVAKQSFLNQIRVCYNISDPHFIYFGFCMFIHKLIIPSNSAFLFTLFAWFDSFNFVLQDYYINVIICSINSITSLQGIAYLAITSDFVLIIDNRMSIFWLLIWRYNAIVLSPLHFHCQRVEGCVWFMDICLQMLMLNSRIFYSVVLGTCSFRI